MIPKWKIKRLIKIGEDYSCPFSVTPFEGNINEGSYNIHKFKETPEFQDFLIDIISLGLHYEYAKKDNEIYMVVTII